MRKAKPESFEKFYYAKVGLGEGCGCAERVIDVYEFNRLSNEPSAEIRPRGLGIADFFRRLSLKFR